MNADVMYQIEREMRANDHRMFYSEVGDIEYTEVEESSMLFRTARKNADRGRVEIRRIVVCNSSPEHKAKRGIKYFVPPSHRSKKAKYFQIFLSFQTIYELAEHYRIGITE